MGWGTANVFFRGSIESMYISLEKELLRRGFSLYYPDTETIQIYNLETESTYIPKSELCYHLNHESVISFWWAGKDLTDFAFNFRTYMGIHGLSITLERKLWDKNDCLVAYQIFSELLAETDVVCALWDRQEVISDEIGRRVYAADPKDCGAAREKALQDFIAERSRLVTDRELITDIPSAIDFDAPYIFIKTEAGIYMQTIC